MHAGRHSYIVYLTPIPPSSSSSETLMARAYQCFGGLSLSFWLYFIHSASTSHVYIVYLGLNHIHDPLLASNYHLQLLSNVFSSQKDATQSILYSYKHSFSGFSAKLNSTQAATLARTEGVITVFKSRTMQLHTTRSWDFMGLTLNYTIDQVAPLQISHGDNTVVGILDTGDLKCVRTTAMDHIINRGGGIKAVKLRKSGDLNSRGIWPESESFKEEPCMGPIPKAWRGQCVGGEQFDPERACNRKLIGARYYLKGFEQEYGPLDVSEYRSPRDANGHGTHTASTAVGSTVKNASFFGFGLGTARGGAPRARLAVYKVCWGDGACTEADILAAFDEALHDGVHVISASFGSSPPLRPLYNSSADIGSFHAMQKGVSVVFSAGNDGPDPSLVQNVAPWSLCIAASSIDRNFPTTLILDNTLSFTGESLLTTQIEARLVGPRRYFTGGVCRRRNWTNRTATGRVILCFSTVGSVESGEAEVAAWRANASALIFVDSLTRQVADVDIIPTVRVDMIQGTKINHYLAGSPTTPIVQIFPSKTVIGKSPAPVVAYFSSRGPSSISPYILKPDLTAPGLNILGAWPPKTSPTSTVIDDRSVKWNFQSGTSMSCPHVAGVVALIKSMHPDWSPAAIRSALMTTAYNKDTTHDTILAGGSMEISGPFDVGAGHINPSKAMDPGLVYDINATDYVNIFLCNSGYTNAQIESIAPGTSASCPPRHMTINSWDLNYPSIAVSNLDSALTIKRTVRNVGQKRTAIYYASISSPQGVEVVVWPRLLFFSYFRQEISYYVTLKPHKGSIGRYDFGDIVWSDGFHYVRSPLVVFVNTSTNIQWASAASHFTSLVREF